MTTLPVGYESYWMLSAAGEACPQLPPDSRIEVDAAVVGSGIAGLSAAWELARAGRSVAVLESDRLAAGVTGHTTAKLSALHGLTYSRLRAERGAEEARHYALSQQGAVDRLAAVAARLGVDCELERVPAHLYVESAEHVDEVRAEAEAAAEAGLAASFVTDTGLPFRVRAAAVRVENQAQFHPRKYLLALADDIRLHGGLLFERTRVVALDEGEPCLLRAENGGEVLARDVVVATHYPVFDRALMFSRLQPRRELVISALLPEEEDPGGTYVSPERGSRSVRTAPYPFGDGRRLLLIVTGEKFAPGTPGTGSRRRPLRTAGRLDLRALPQRPARPPLGHPGQRDHRPGALHRALPRRDPAHLRRRGLRWLGDEFGGAGRAAARRPCHRRAAAAVGAALRPGAAARR